MSPSCTKIDDLQKRAMVESRPIKQRVVTQGPIGDKKTVRSPFGEQTRGLQPFQTSGVFCASSILRSYRSSEKEMEESHRSGMASEEDGMGLGCDEG